MATTLEVTLPSGQVQSFASATDLKAAILRGEVVRQAKACRVSIAADGKRTATTIVPVDKMTDTRTAYLPIWDHTMKGALYGALVCVGLKELDSAAGLFMADTGLGLGFLLIIAGAVLASRFPAVWIAGGAMLVGHFQLVTHLYTIALGAAVVGALFGIPLGMIGGCTVGWMRRARLQRAPDAIPEGSRPLWLGLALPALALAVMVPLYVWFNVKLLAQLVGQ